MIKTSAKTNPCGQQLNRTIRPKMLSFGCFIFFLYVLLNSGQVVFGQNNDACVEDFLKTNPDMHDRFEKKQLETMCNKLQTWAERANEPRAMAAAPEPEKQREWLQTVRGCRGSKCITDVVKCDGEHCHDKKELPLPPGTVGAAAAKFREPFPDYSLQAEEIVKYNIDEIDAEVLKGDQNDLKSCEIRMWLANVCYMVLNSDSAEGAFPDTVVTYKKDDKEKMKKQMDDQYTKYKSKCGDMQKALGKDDNKFSTVKPCNDITKPQSTDKKIVGEKCLEVLKAKTPGEAFPELKESVTTDYARNLLSDEYAEWLVRCRSLRDTLTDKNQTFNDWINNSKFKRQALPAPGADTRAHRQEIRMLTDDERRRFFNALNGLKTNLIDGTSQYDLLARHHFAEDSPGAHTGAAFLPFHREYLKQVEIALRLIDPSVALSYWDSTLDNGLPNPRDSILWTPEFFGNGDGAVTTGPFANWVTTVELPAVPGMRTLYRNIGVGTNGLYQEADVDRFTHFSSFPEFTYCVNEAFELVHGTVHNFVGGFLEDLDNAANDPVFYMHHCFIDYIWEEFRQNRQAPADRERGYPEDSPTCRHAQKTGNHNHFASATMRPFTITNIEGLSNSYANQLYYYQPRPTCSAASPTCSSPYLFCDTTRYRCLSKVRLNGACTGFEGTDICHGGRCVSGRCTAS